MLLKSRPEDLARLACAPIVRSLGRGSVKMGLGLLRLSAAGLLCFFLVVGSLSAANAIDDKKPGFTEDAQAAFEKAIKEDKELLILFTGSDWCPPCKKLEAEVLSEEDFLFEVTRHYVLLKLDFPKSIEQSPELVKQNQELADKFGVDSFPTIVLTDKNLKPFAFAGYETGGFQNYLGLLEEARQLRVRRDEALAQAKDKTGDERAKLLNQAISEMREEIIEVYYADIIAEIVELDADNHLGLREKWNAAADAEMRQIIMTDIAMVARLEKPSRAIEFIDEVLGMIEFKPAERLEVLQVKLNLVRKLNDNTKTDALLNEMIALEGVQGETKERLIVKKVYLMIGSGREAAAMQLLEDSIATEPGANFLNLAKGEALAAKGDFAGAIKAFDQAIKTSRGNPDLMIELVSGKADALFELKDEAAALQTLDNFSEDTGMPADLRAEALLHKSLIMRDMNRTRQARLAENRAVEVTESATEKAELQRIVERLRAKFGG